MWSANALNFIQSKMLSFGKEQNNYKQIRYVWIWVNDLSLPDDQSALNPVFCTEWSVVKVTSTIFVVEMITGGIFEPEKFPNSLSCCVTPSYTLITSYNGSVSNSEN